MTIAALVAGGSLYLTRTSLVHYVRSRKELLSRVNDLFGWVISGELTVHMSGQWPLADARSAHDELESRRSTGKLLLIP
jgi:NADPH2:quinone reductase